MGFWEWMEQVERQEQQDVEDFLGVNEPGFGHPEQDPDIGFLADIFKTAEGEAEKALAELEKEKSKQAGTSLLVIGIAGFLVWKLWFSR